MQLSNCVLIYIHFAFWQYQRINPMSLIVGIDSVLKPVKFYFLDKAVYFYLPLFFIATTSSLTP